MSDKYLNLHELLPSPASSPAHRLLCVLLCGLIILSGYQLYRQGYVAAALLCVPSTVLLWLSWLAARQRLRLVDCAGQLRFDSSMDGRGVLAVERVIGVPGVLFLRLVDTETGRSYRLWLYCDVLSRAAVRRLSVDQLCAGPQEINQHREHYPVSG